MNEHNKRWTTKWVLEEKEIKEAPRFSKSAREQGWGGGSGRAEKQ